MAEILSTSHSEKNIQKEGFLKSITESFKSLDRFTQGFILTTLLLIVVTPFIVNQYLNILQEAAFDNPPSINDFYSSKTYISTITPPTSFRLSWNTSFVGFCNASGAWFGRKSANGSETLIMSLEQAKNGPTYTLTCYGKNNQRVSKSIVVMTPSNTPPSGQGGIAGGPCNPYGDVDHNGYINSYDSSRVLQIVAVTGNRPTDSEKRRADVDNSGSVTSVDSLKILNFIAGKDKTFSVCGKPF